MSTSQSSPPASATASVSPSGTPSPFGAITQDDLKASYSNSIIIVNACMAALAIVAVGFRIYARRYTKQHLGWDDWLIVAAVPLAIAECVGSSFSAANGMGRHVYTLTPEEIPRQARSSVASQVIWGAAVPLVKTSVVLLYVRIFGTLTYFRRFAWAITIFNIVWGIMVCLVCALQCIPLEALWDLTITDKQCINAGLFFIIGSAPDFITDFLILILPIPAVWSLHTSTAQKISLSGVFLLGSFTCIVSIIRFAQLCINATNPDITWGLGGISIWSTVEICIGITAACLPTTWPLFIRAFPGLARLGGTTQQKKYKPSGGKSDFEMGRSTGKHAARRSKHKNDVYSNLSAVETNIGAHDSLDYMNPPPHGIQVDWSRSVR